MSLGFNSYLLLIQILTPNLKQFPPQAPECTLPQNGSDALGTKATLSQFGPLASSSTTWSRATSPLRKTSRSAMQRSTFAATCQQNARSWSEGAFASGPKTDLTCQVSSTIPGWPLLPAGRKQGGWATATYHTTDTSPHLLPPENQCSQLPSPCSNKQLSIHDRGDGVGQTKLLSGQHHLLNDREREEQHLKTNHANLNPVDNSVWKIENWKLLSFCNVPYRSKFPTKWIEDLCAPLAYMGGTKNLAYTCFRLPAKTYLLVNLRKRLHLHLKKQNQRIYIFNKRKKKF